MSRAMAGLRGEPQTGGEIAISGARQLLPAADAAQTAFVTPEKVWNFLRRQKWLFAITLALSLLFGILFIALSPAKYRSLTRLLVDPQGLLILKNDITRTSDSADANLLDVENQRYVILSRSVLAATVKRAHLEDSPMFGNAPPGLLSRILAAFGRKPTQQDREDKAIAALADCVEVVRGERAYILDIIVTTRDPNVSADLANLIAKVYLEQEQEARTQTAKRASEALNKRANDLGREVQQADEDVANFRLSHNLSFNATGQFLGDQQISDLNAQLALAKGRTAAAQARVDELEHLSKAKLDPSQLPEAMQSPVITALRGQYAQLVQQEAAYITQFGPKHPALVQVREQMQDVRNLIANEVARVAQSARGDLNRAKAAEAALNRSIERARQENGDDAGALARLHELERAAEAKKSIYQSVLTRQKELEEQQGIDTNNTRVISDAVPATKPSGPPPALLLAGATIFGLGLGAGIGALREMLGGEPQTQESLERLFDAPFLGYFAGGRHKSAEARRNDRQTAIASLDYLCRDLEVPAILGLLSPHSDENRMDVLAELASAGRDGNLALGFVDCHSGAAAAKNRDLIVPAADFAPQEANETPIITPLADLLIRERGPLTLRNLRRTLRDYAAGKDLVFLNLPPVIDVGMPPVLLEAVDAVVVVLSETDTERRKIERLVEFINKTETPVAGYVVIGERHGR